MAAWTAAPAPGCWSRTRSPCERAWRTAVSGRRASSPAARATSADATVSAYAAPATRNPRLYSAPRWVLTPQVAASISASAWRPIRPRSWRSRGAAPGMPGARAAVRANVANQGWSTAAERRSIARSISSCAPEPRRSTSPGLGVSSASARRAPAARHPRTHGPSARARRPETRAGVARSAVAITTSPGTRRAAGTSRRTRSPGPRCSGPPAGCGRPGSGRRRGPPGRPPARPGAAGRLAGT